MENNQAQEKRGNRQVPFNTTAEMYILGAVLIDNKIMDALIGKLAPEDFYDEKNKIVFTSMVNLRNRDQVIDNLTVVEDLKRLKITNAESYGKYLVEMADMVPSTSSVGAYIDIVLDKAIGRRLLKTMEKLSDEVLLNKYDSNEQLERVEDQIMNIVKLRHTSDFMDLAEAARETYDKINSMIGRNDGLTGLNTGYPNLNKTTLGFQKGDLMILAARPSVGKSTYAVNLALQIAKENNAHVAFFSLEMSIEQLLMRIYSYQANVDLSKIRKGDLSPDDLLLLGMAKEELSKLNIHFDTNSSSNIADIRAKCRQLKEQNKLDFVVIDYLQLINSTNSRGNRQEEVSQISRQLKRLAQELDVPIMALSQLSRSIEGREDRRPQLSDLRESGSIEQDADIVMFIYRRSDVEGKDEEVADELNEKVKEATGIKDNEKTNKEVIQVVVSIAKNRQGKLDNFDYNFYGHFCRFAEQREFRKFAMKKNNNSGMRSLKNQ